MLVRNRINFRLSLCRHHSTVALSAESNEIKSEGSSRCQSSISRAQSLNASSTVGILVLLIRVVVHGFQFKVFRVPCSNSTKLVCSPASIRALNLPQAASLDAIQSTD